MVKVKTQSSGLVVIEPNQRLFENHQGLSEAGVQQVEPGKTFRIFIAKFGKHYVDLRPNKVVAKTEDHSYYITEADILHGEVLDRRAYTTRYLKRDTEARDIETINNHLADGREAHAGVDETPTTVDNIELKVHERYHTDVCNMLQRHENICTGKLGDINTTKHGIDLKPAARPFKSAPYRAGQKKRELEQFEIDKHFQAVVN